MQNSRVFNCQYHVGVSYLFRLGASSTISIEIIMKGNEFVSYSIKSLEFIVLIVLPNQEIEIKIVV
jgi:hypothetical protein